MIGTAFFNKTDGKAPFIHAIIVTWNKKNDLLRLLASLQYLNYPKECFSILVVDNASEDGTAEAVESRFPHVKILRIPENCGGAGGFNAGMRWVLSNRPDADYLWLLDNDVVVDANALAVLVRVMENHPNAAVCGSRIMDINKRNQLIETGALIDYHKGGIRRHQPDFQAKRNQNGVFRVDYVAACSLLARVPHVREAGLWQEKFFIYWDDMEWGARFNVMDREVLAANASVVYHPSWTGRVADCSDIWRNYYRVRNSFCFFSQYTHGWHRRRLLIKLMLRYTAIATLVGLKSHTKLSMAYMQGMKDFLNNRFGKIEFTMPASDLSHFFKTKQKNTVGVFVSDKDRLPEIYATTTALCRRFSNIRIKAIMPQTEKKYWEQHFGAADNILTYRLNSSGRIFWGDKLRIMHSFIRSPWQMLICSDPIPRMFAILGNDVARVDFEKEEVIAIEVVNYRHLMRLPFILFSFLIKFAFTHFAKTDPMPPVDNHKTFGAGGVKRAA